MASFVHVAASIAQPLLAALGFAEVGITAGSIAALVQSLVYGGAVPAGCLFAILQSLGMTASFIWGWAWAPLLGVGCALPWIKRKIQQELEKRLGDVLRQQAEQNRRLEQ